MQDETEIWFATPGPLADALPYRVVVGGRSVFRRAEGRISQPFHQHTLICTVEGEGLIEVGGQVFVAPIHSLVWLDTSRPYAHGAAGPSAWRYLWLGLQGQGLDRLHESLRLPDRPVTTPAEPDSIAQPMKEVLADLARPKPGSDARAAAAIAQILAHLVALRADVLAVKDTSRLSALRRALRQDPARNWTVADMAEIARLGPAQLFRRFRSETGATPMGWLRQERMERARYLLAGSADSVTQIAQRCGYLDPFHFSRDFKRLTGKSPRAFRVERNYGAGIGQD